MVLIKVELEAEESLHFKTNAIYSKNTYSYMENNIKVKVKKLYSKIVINRSCSEYEITLNLDKDKDTISYYSVFGGSKKFELATHVKKMILSDKMISVQYELEGNCYKFKLEEI